MSGERFPSTENPFSGHSDIHWYYNLCSKNNQESDVKSSRIRSVGILLQRLSKRTSPGELFAEEPDHRVSKTSLLQVYAETLRIGHQRKHRALNLLRGRNSAQCDFLLPKCCHFYRILANDRLD